MKSYRVVAFESIAETLDRADPLTANLQIRRGLTDQELAEERRHRLLQGGRTGRRPRWERP